MSNILVSYSNLERLTYSLEIWIALENFNFDALNSEVFERYDGLTIYPISAKC